VTFQIIYVPLEFPFRQEASKRYQRLWVFTQTAGTGRNLTLDGGVRWVLLTSRAMDYRPRVESVHVTIGGATPVTVDDYTGIE